MKFEFAEKNVIYMLLFARLSKTKHRSEQYLRSRPFKMQGIKQLARIIYRVFRVNYI